jgi:two-component system alkaline phosphatase synthesis response regulator PhoP
MDTEEKHMTRIYCVEDDQSIREIEIYTLNSTGFEAEGFQDARSFFEAIKTKKPDLVLLDIMLPQEDGISVLRRLRSASETSDLPVIIASARGTEFDKIKGLDLGADDYLVKPFGMMEMVSRVKAVLRRFSPKEESVLERNEIFISVTRHTVHVSGQEVELTLKEFDLLRLLMSHPGIVYTREQLLNQVWGSEYDGETRTVDVHVRTLRQKLGDAGTHIDTVRGIGYRYLEENPA